MGNPELYDRVKLKSMILKLSNCFAFVLQTVPNSISSFLGTVKHLWDKSNIELKKINALCILKTYYRRL